MTRVVGPTGSSGTIRFRARAGTVLTGGLLLFGAALAGCGDRQPKGDSKAVVGFTRVLTDMAGADRSRSAARLADGAYRTVARSEKCLESFAAAATERARMEALLDCGLACTLDAIQRLKGKEPRTWMAALAAACEAPHFGLEKADIAMLSSDWFLLHKVGQIAAPHIEAARGADRAALDKALGVFRLPLPLPAAASGLYQLPLVPVDASVPFATTSSTYVIVPAAGPLRVGATPYGTLGPRGAAMSVPDGQVRFPGNETAGGEVAAAVREAAGAPAEAPIPLLLADGGRLVEDVVDVVAAFPSVVVAVGSPEDPAVRALAVEVRLLRDNSFAEAEDTMLIHVTEGEPWRDHVEIAADEVALGMRRILLGSDRYRVPGQPVERSVVTEGDVTVDGVFPDSTVIPRLLSSRMGALQACYERELARGTLDGNLDLELELTIGADGAVRKVKGSGLGKVAACAVPQLKALKFPPAPDGKLREVRYPLLFEPKGE